MNTHQLPHELADLLEDFCLGELTASQAARLEQLVFDSQENRIHYLRFVQMHALALRFESVRPHRTTEISGGSAVGDHSHSVLPSSPVLGFLGKTTATSTGWLTSPKSLAVAVCACLVTYFVSLFIALGVERAWWVASKPLQQPADMPDVRPVARLLASENCRWSDDPSVPVSGDLSARTPLKLLSGMAAIQFESGTRVVIEGPTEFEVRSSNAAFLNVGKLAATVPARAVGFTVDTPSASVVDLGTEFGVIVTRDGDSNVAVKSGKIDVLPNRVPATEVRKPRRLVAGEGIRVTKAQGGVTPLPAADFHFVQSIGEKDTANLPPEAQYRVLAWYRCGEDDPEAVTGEPNLQATATLPNTTAALQEPLLVTGPAWYTKESAPLESTCALRFDPELGSRLARVNKLPIVTDNWVLEVWARADSMPKHCTVAHVGEASKNGFGLYVINGIWGGHTVDRAFTGAAKCEIGKWTHLALLRERGRFCFFVDGLQVGSTWVAEFKTPDDILAIGGFRDPVSGVVSETFPGILDEVRLVQLVRPFHPRMLLTNSLPSTKSIVQEKESAVTNPSRQLRTKPGFDAN